MIGQTEPTAVSGERKVDRFNQEKLYIQVARLLIEEITSGNWKLNACIPSEDQLCDSYGVSKTTIRQAINILVADGYLMKVQGKGTFVTGDQPSVAFTMRTRPTEERFGKEVRAERTITARGEVEPPAEVRSAFTSGDRVHYLQTKTAVDGETVYIQESYIPRRILPEIDGRAIEERSLYALLQERGRKKVFKVVQTIEIGRASGDAARMLDLAEGQPVLVVHRLFSSSDDTPVAYSRIQGRSDRYKFQTEFERLR